MISTKSAGSTADNATVKRPRGRPFQKGQPRPAGAGRRRGAINKATKDIREFIQGITLGDETFCENLSAFCKSSQVFDKPHLLAVLFAYGFGKAVPMEPKEEHRSPLLFVMQNGKQMFGPDAYDPLEPKMKALAARKAERELRAATSEAYEPPKDTDPDALVVIEPEPNTLAVQAMARPGSR